jgi:hypothetical protein
LYFTAVSKVVYKGFEADPEAGVLSDGTWQDEGGNADQNYCTNLINAKHSGNCCSFCNNAPEASGCGATCAACSDCAGRRELGSRRKLNTVFTGGAETLEVSAKVTINPLKAQINGKVSRGDNLIRFVLELQMTGKMQSL